MPSTACLNLHSCLARRKQIFSQDSVRTWDSECGCCQEGTARAMHTHKPEVDPHDTQSKTAVAKRVARPPDVCSTCGKVVTRGAKICKKCWGLSRRVNHAKCSVAGCRWFARRRGLCHSHYFKGKQAEKRATA